MKNKLKNAARFVLENFFLTLAVLMFAWIALSLLFSLGNEQPAHTVGFSHFIAHLALAFVYVAGGWDLHRWVEQRERRKWQKEWK